MTRTKTRTAAPSSSVVVASKVRARVRELGLNLGADALEQLSANVLELVEVACSRASANRRRTVRAHDFTPAPLAAKGPKSLDKGSRK